MKPDFLKPTPKPLTLEESYSLIDALWHVCRKFDPEVSSIKKEMEELKCEVVIQRNERAELKDEVLKLKKENAELKEKLNINSQNSSKPPSSDLFKKKKKNKARNTKSNRKRGGQPGHIGLTRTPLPPEEVDHFITCSPPAQCECGHSIQKTIDFKQHQVHELPLVKPIVTEYQLFDGICCGCGKKHLTQLPLGVPKGMLGPVAMSKVATLTGNYRLSKRNTVNLLQDFYGLHISIGTVSNVEKVVSLALQSPVEEMVKFIPKQPAVHMDETSHKEQNNRMWTWIAATTLICIFFIRKGRNMAVSHEILGKNFSGILISDRYSAYNWVDFRQLCWPHLKRDFKKISERSGKSGRVGDVLLLYHRKMFMYWHRVKSGKLTREKFKCLMIPIRFQIETMLAEGAVCGHAKTQRTCQNILGYKSFLWTFVEKVGIDPTNNLAERLLRRFVIWRKTSFGTQSETGSRFMERVMSVAGTCQLQKRNVLDFISQAIRAHLTHQEFPSLLPHTATLSLAA
jgi:transposase